MSKKPLDPPETPSEQTPPTPEQVIQEMQRQAAEVAQVEAVRRAIEPLAHINLLNPAADPEKKSIPAEYRICRCGVKTTITNEHILAARRVMTDAVSLAEARLALVPLAKLPLDYQVTDPNRPLYQFTGKDGRPFAVTTKDIEIARKLSQE